MLSKPLNYKSNIILMATIIGGSLVVCGKDPVKAKSTKRKEFKIPWITLNMTTDPIEA